MFHYKKLYNFLKQCSKTKECLILRIFKWTMKSTCKIESIILIMFNPLSSSGTKREMSLISGIKSSKLSESIGANHLSVGIPMWGMTLSIGMPGLKLIKRKPIINSALLAKLKLMIRSLNPQKYRDRLGRKWRNKVFLLTKERISMCSQACTSTVKCGKKGVTKQPCSFSD